MLRGTTLIHLSLTAQALTSAGCVHQKHPILRRDDGRSRRSLKGKTVRLRSSKTMFGAAFCARLQLPGLSVPYLRAYSSLRCLWINKAYLVDG